LNSFDAALYHSINSLAGHHPVLDIIMKILAQYSLEIYFLLFIIAWFALPKREEAQRHALIVAGFGGILALTINFLITQVWYRPRPFVVLAPGSYTKLIPHAIDASFPSDHASGSVAFARGAWGRTSRWVTWSFTLLAVLVPIARVYCGVHWPTDVLASTVVGLFSGWIVWHLSRLLSPFTRLGLFICRFGPFAKRSPGPKRRLP